MLLLLCLCLTACNRGADSANDPSNPHDASPGAYKCFLADSFRISQMPRRNFFYRLHGGSISKQSAYRGQGEHTIPPTASYCKLLQATASYCMRVGSFPVQFDCPQVACPSGRPVLSTAIKIPSEHTNNSLSIYFWRIKDSPAQSRQQRAVNSVVQWDLRNQIHL